MSSDKIVFEASGLVGTGTTEPLKLRENTANAKGEQHTQLAFGAIKAVRTVEPR